MPYTNLAAATKNSRASALNTAIGGTATLGIYSGAPPAGPDAAPTGTLLATLTCAAGAFGSVAAGVLTAGAITQGTAATTGTPGWARVSNAGGVAIMDLDVGAVGSGAAVIITPAAITASTPVACNSLTVTEA